MIDNWFWKNVDNKENKEECWPWLLSHDNNGYGKCKHNKKTNLSHRLAYLLWYKTPIEGWIIRHKCDNPICCNPFHLELGTQADNMNDRLSRHGDHKGEHNYYHKLFEEEVLNIRFDAYKGIILKDIANKFKIHPSTVSDIVIGETWTHSFNPKLLPVEYLKNGNFRRYGHRVNPSDFDMAYEDD